MKVVIAAGYVEDGWHSMRLLGEQLARGCQEYKLSKQPDWDVDLFMPVLGHQPRWLDRRMRYGQGLPKADLLHHIDSSYGDCVWQAKEKCPRVIVTVNDLAFWRQRTWLNSFFRHRIVKGLQYADGLIAISQQTSAEMVTDLGRPADRVIYPGISAELFPLSKDQRQDGLILNVGSSLPRKGLDRLLRLMKQLPQKYHLLQVGGQWSPDLEELIVELDLGDRVQNIPHVTKSQLVQLYQRCHLAVFPSRYEGFGMPAVEARLCGAPVLLNHVIPALEILSQDQGTRIADFSGLDIDGEGGQQVVERILSISPHSISLANREFFGWQRAATEHLDFYQMIYSGAMNSDLKSFG